MKPNIVARTQTLINDLPMKIEYCYSSVLFVYMTFLSGVISESDLALLMQISKWRMPQNNTVMAPDRQLPCTVHELEFTCHVIN